MIQVWSVPQGTHVEGLVPSLVLLGSGVAFRGWRSLGPWGCAVEKGTGTRTLPPLPLPCHEMNSLILIFHSAAVGPATAGAMDRNLHTVRQVASPLYKLMIVGI